MWSPCPLKIAGNRYIHYQSNNIIQSCIFRNPAWSVATILTGLLSFMLEKSPTLGSIETVSSSIIMILIATYIKYKTRKKVP